MDKIPEHFTNIMIGCAFSVTIYSIIIIIWCYIKDNTKD